MLYIKPIYYIIIKVVFQSKDRKKPAEQAVCSADVRSDLYPPPGRRHILVQRSKLRAKETPSRCIPISSFIRSPRMTDWVSSKTSPFSQRVMR